MLLETIQRHDTKNQIKLVCVEVLKAKGENVPSQVTCVPTLLTLPERRLLTGKLVFDYLLLPGKGKLLMPVNEAAHTIAETAQTGSVPNGQPQDPIAFTIGGFGESFTDINHQGSIGEGVLPDKAYNWTLISDHENTPMSVSDFKPEETRPKKPAIDIERYKMERDMDLQQSDINTTVVVPPSFTR
jgi:hypothetical protein